ncbi:uncharacterized protein LOC124450436 isoform X2 [Xenia sp. Carnegie-2017]|uniref:uncharacterized protein LOC124450436 isoform X2 n=1 Tax=Xenia sp. Carnegie-2017 TaxID=2897299 RepID=UPI001F03CEFC|nr:uncharacterized protein LOC124450436 isoform X2 [Xenia sp. Carnegie-2017]XP_046857049.1 uncharacterized protein LOC124450436 isoform X2 [Xenia sp. Carnegie-2017]
MEKDCLSTSALSVAQNQCNGKKKCSFTVRKEDFLSRPSSYSETSTLLVYYTCKTPKSSLSCDVFRDKPLECGNNVQLQDQCPKTCCFNHTVNPPCYFNIKGYGPIKHANGLCINVQGTQRLIWSRDCTSRNAFFLFSYDYPPYHVTTGKCILPSNLNLGDPGNNVELLLTGSRYCGGPIGRYRPITNGNLDYFHTDTPYKICIGGSSVDNNEWQPNDNENVFINKKVCDVNNSCKFNYVYERKIENGDDLNIQFDESCFNWVIEMRSAEFGVLLKERGRIEKPYGISSMKKDCVSTSALSVAQNQCNGKKKCSFTVRKEDFLSRPSSCRETSTLLIYYTCKTPKSSLSCDVSGGKRLECGNNVQQQDQCPETCCFNQTVNPPCYFNRKGYGPIKHANGLCINVQGTQRLIWSSDCTSRNAFFLLSYDYPPYHVTTGKCILPSNLKLADPGTRVELFLTESRFCGGHVGRYRPNKNGNLYYFHNDGLYKICIGGSSVVNNEWQPNGNEVVFIDEKVCEVNNSCKFNYVYERKIENGDDLNIQCDESCSNWVIEMRSAEFGVLLKERGRSRKPYGISSMKKDCLSTSALSVAQNQCNGIEKCSFTVRKEDFLSRPSNCRETSTLLVYYTCKTPKSVVSTTTVTQVNPLAKSNPLPAVPSTEATLPNSNTSPSKKTTMADLQNTLTKSSKKDSDNSGVIAGAAVGAVLLVVLLVLIIFFFCRRRRKPRADHFYSEAVNYNKKSREEELLAVSINDESERPSPENIEKKRNVVTAPSDDVYATPDQADETAVGPSNHLYEKPDKTQENDIIVQSNDLYAYPEETDKNKIMVQPNELYAFPDETDKNKIVGQSNDLYTLPDKTGENMTKAPSGDLYSKPDKTGKEESQYENRPESIAYANNQVYSSVNEDSGIKITRFLMYVQEMKKSDNFGFKKEFEELPTGQIHPWDVGKSAKNAKKNKYNNNTAYDHSRVILSGADSYINANLIQGIQSEVYIASQGPMADTVNEFWRMIWEQDCTSIICLTKIVEMGKVKCFQYWTDEETSFGEIVVKTRKTEMFADYVIRYLDVKKGGTTKKVTQYHFLSWPDHGVPRYPTKLLVFRQRFRAMHLVDTKPIVVHCSAGVGRTGAFIALDMSLRRISDLNQPTVNIKETVQDMRNQRINMVQTLEQYVFVYEAVLEIILCGLTEIAAQDLRTEVERLEQKELNKSLNGFEIEFNTLSSVRPSFTAEDCATSLLPENQSKNRDMNICPAENSRVYLSGAKDGEECYINATYVHGYTQAKAYIATQTPLAHTINDFWRMAFERKTVVIVMLNTISEGLESYPKYWPEKPNRELQYGDLFVELMSFESRGPIVLRKFIIRSKSTEEAVVEHVVRHVQFTRWPEHEFPKNYDVVLDLLNAVEEAQQRSPNGVVIVHCSNGAHRTGTYLTLAIQRDRIRTEHVLDIFRCIKVLREERPQFVPNVEHYRFCYYAMLAFVESFKTYDNIPKVQKE